MGTLQDKIYSYFERDPQLKVLFVFDGESLDTPLAAELQGAEWKDGYRYVEFKGDWFTTKYRLDNEWKDDKVVLLFKQRSPMSAKSLQDKFPLMDVLVANKEYQQQTYLAFMQQYGIPDTDRNIARFVDANIATLQSEKMVRLLKPYYDDHTISLEKFVCAFISHYLGQQSVLDWDSILLRVLFLGRNSESAKRKDFFSRLVKCREAKDLLQTKFLHIFGVNPSDSFDSWLQEIARRFKYNLIVQNLACLAIDNYASYRIKNSTSIQQMNHLFDVAQANASWSKMLLEVFADLADEIAESNIILYYNTDADYYFITDKMCNRILDGLMKNQIETNPALVISRIGNLIARRDNYGEYNKVMDFITYVAHFYEQHKLHSTFVLNTPSDYVSLYEKEYYLLDYYYRKALEVYFSIEITDDLKQTIDNVKENLNSKYSKVANILNLEWNRCLLDKGGFSSINMLRQQDFYDKIIKPQQNKVAVIVSDALRYEVAKELFDSLSVSKHSIQIDTAMAMLPTETKFCKPSLLPHSSLKLYGDEEAQNMSVDDKILDNIDKRTQHIMAYRNDAVCVRFEDVAQYNRDKNRELFKNRLVYIFHDTIDKVGHDGTVSEIVEACSKAVSELFRLVKYLHDTCNVTNVYIVSDHGFLFNDIEFTDRDKIPIADTTLERKTRYYLTATGKDVDGVIKFPLSSVSAMDNAENVYVAVPKGTNRFSAQGGGYRFTHGGAALQEIIIPVIYSHFEKTDTKQPVDVRVIENQLSIRSSRVRFRIMQTDPVSQDRRARSITVGLYDNDKPVSQIKEFTLDSASDSLDARTTWVDLTLNTNVDSRLLKLKIFDADDNLNPLIKDNVTNNTLIETDFD